MSMNDIVKVLDEIKFMMEEMGPKIDMLLLKTTNPGNDTNTLSKPVRKINILKFWQYLFNSLLQDELTDAKYTNFLKEIGITKELVLNKINSSKIKKREMAEKSICKELYSANITANKTNKTNLNLLKLSYLESLSDESDRKETNLDEDDDAKEEAKDDDKISKVNDGGSKIIQDEKSTQSKIESKIVETKSSNFVKTPKKLATTTKKKIDKKTKTKKATDSDDDFEHSEDVLEDSDDGSYQEDVISDSESNVSKDATEDEKSSDDELFDVMKDVDEMLDKKHKVKSEKDHVTTVKKATTDKFLNKKNAKNNDDVIKKNVKYAYDEEY